MERLIDPAIGDLQVEHADAIRSGHIWKSGLALFVGYVAFVKVFALCGLFGTIHSWRNWDPDDRGGLNRILWSCVVVTLVTTMLLAMPELLRLPDMPGSRGDANVALLILYLIPSALALSVPAALAIGTTLGLNGRSASRRLVAAMLLIALVTSVASLANVAWLTPLANQSYREEVVGRFIPRGQHELTLTELQGSLDGSFVYHGRLALAAAPLTFAVFGLVIATRRRLGRAMSVGAAFLGAVGYLLIAIAGSDFSRTGLMPPTLAAWMPQFVLIAATIVLRVLARSHGTSIIQTRA